MPFRKLKCSSKLTSSRLPLRRLKPKLWLKKFQLKRMPRGLKSRVRLNFKELLLKRLKLNSLLSKLEMTRSLKLLPMPPR